MHKNSENVDLRAHMETYAHGLSSVHFSEEAQLAALLTDPSAIKQKVLSLNILHYKAKDWWTQRERDMIFPKLNQVALT